PVRRRPHARREEGPTIQVASSTGEPSNGCLLREADHVVFATGQRAFHRTVLPPWQGARVLAVLLLVEEAIGACHLVDALVAAIGLDAPVVLDAVLEEAADEVAADDQLGFARDDA